MSGEDVRFSSKSCVLAGTFSAAPDRIAATLLRPACWPERTISGTTYRRSP